MTSPDPTPLPLQIGGRTFAWGERTYVMGIVNATPDSFSGDGVLDAGRAANLAAQMVEDGADLLDIGAESTRPDHLPVSADEEWERLAPVLAAVRTAVSVPITVDTTKAAVAERAFDAGADALNDIQGLRGDPALRMVVASRGLPVIAMHNQRGRTSSGDVIADVIVGFRASLRAAEEAGIPGERIILDPGFGFGWRPEENLKLLRRLSELRAPGRPLLVGTSRKSTIGVVLEHAEGERLWGTAATVALAVQAAADIVRVHDVVEMAQVARMADAVVRGWTPESP